MVITTGALIGMGALSGLGSIGSGLMGGHSAKKAAKAQADAIRDAANMQINWERERAQNAHQWEIKDLQAAGLNPILSAGGTGAQTGGIDVGIPDTGPIAAEGAAYGKGIEGLMQAPLSAMQAKASLDNFNADTNLKGAQALESVATAALQNKKALTEISTTAKNYADTMLKDQQYKQQAELFEKQLNLLQQQIETEIANKNYTKVKILQASFDQKMQNYQWWIDNIIKGTQAATGAVNAAANVVRAAKPVPGGS